LGRLVQSHDLPGLESPAVEARCLKYPQDTSGTGQPQIVGERRIFVSMEFKH
jgi:hypothetical protein